MPSKPYNAAIDEILASQGGPAAATAVAMDQLFVEWSSGELGAVEGDRASGADEVNYLLEGAAHFTADGAHYELGPGQALYLPAGIEDCDLEGTGKLLRIAGGIPWERVHLAEQHISGLYRDWPAINS